MEWALVREGRAGPEEVLLILADRADAESIAVEVRRKGHRVSVTPFTAALSAQRVPARGLTLAVGG